MEYTPNSNLYKPNRNDDVDIDTSLAENFTKIDSQLAQTMMKLEADIVVTVGLLGDYQTINDALAFLSKKTPVYKKNGYVAEIRLLSGFIMSEQVVFRNVDLNWIVIRSDDAIVQVNRSAITTAFPLRGGFLDYPIFSAENSRLPRFDGVIFNMDNTGVGERRHGLAIRENSFVTFGYYCGFLNCGGYGIYGAYNSFVDAKNIDVSNSGLSGICMRHKSELLARDDGLGAPPKANNCDIGIEADWNSKVFWRNGQTRDAKTFGVLANQGSEVVAPSLDARKSLQHGIYVQNGSFVHAPSANVSECVVDGVRGLHSSTLSARQITANNCGGAGINISRNCNAEVEGGNVSFAGQQGIIAVGNSTVEARGVNATRCGVTGIRATEGSRINAQSASTIRHEGGTEGNNDFRVSTGSIINAGGATGGTWVTPNTLTVDGIIFK